jgi:dethiobiotin synthetase
VRLEPRNGLVVITGTGTDVGKTYVAAALAGALGAHARKPVQSFDAADAMTDADVLAAASGEAVERVCPRHRWLPLPMAPPMAADALGLPPIHVADLLRELEPQPPGITLVEGAGGLLSPLAHDGDTRSLIEGCGPDAVVVVADAGLGTIGLVRLCAEALSTAPIVYMNRFDDANDLHRRNAAWLRTHEGLEVVTDLEALAATLRKSYE